MEDKAVRQNDETEIDLLEILMLMLHNLPLILLTGLLTALIALLGTLLLISPTYSSTTRIYILSRQDNNSITYSDLQMGTQLTKDYAQLIKSRFVLEEVIQDMGLHTTYEEFSSRVSVTTPADTRILAITVTDSDPVQAMQLANAIRKAASVHIMNVMDIQAVNVVETANMPMRKSGPNTMKNTMTGGMLGVLLVAGLLLIRFLMDDTIKTPEDVEKYLNLYTLASIPAYRTGGNRKKNRRHTGRRRR